MTIDESVLFLVAILPIVYLVVSVWGVGGENRIDNLWMKAFLTLVAILPICVFILSRTQLTYLAGLGK
jgi:hypothetical protein